MIATAKLHDLAAEARRARASWEHLVRHDPQQRVCELLHHDDVRALARVGRGSMTPASMTTADPTA